MKSSFVSLVGRPNSGKSTLLNCLLGTKVAITTNKPQTTRDLIQGIYTKDDVQLVFIDTPGIHKPSDMLSSHMTKIALSTLNDVDLILYIVDVTKEYGSGDEFVTNELKKCNTPVFLVANKIDLFSKQELLEKLLELEKIYDFEKIIPLSAAHKLNIEVLLEAIIENSENGPQYYETGYLTNRPKSFIMKEIIREKIINLTKEEIPYSIAIVIDDLTEIEQEINLIASIIVERDSQKGIIIGKNGRMIAKINELARKELAKVLSKKIDLELFVKVKKNWRNNPKYLQEWGYGGDDMW